MEATRVIRKPEVTEKSTYMSAEANRYTFEVDRRATKPQIRKAIEELYNVRVLAVATQTRPGKTKRTKQGYVSSTPTKRAIVKVHADDRIELF